MSVLPFALRLTCCCCCWITCFVFLIRPVFTSQDRPAIHDRPSSYQSARHESVSSYLGDIGVYDDGEVFPDDSDEDYAEANATAEKGRYLGSPCDLTCNPELQHVFCDPITGSCECQNHFPVRLGPTKGCAKPKRLGEQCFYRATCTYSDQHATCMQVQHNAVCDCEEGYHRVALSRPSRKVFCAEDLVLITTDVPTLLGVASGIAVFTALICFVLKLFSRARYSRPRHYANANHAPPMLFSSDTGIPLTLHGGRPSSRSSQRSSGEGPLNCGFSRRPSSGGSRGPLVPASRAGSRRPSLASIHSSTSSARSYSARRLERERNEKEQRQAFQELKLAKQREQQQQRMEQENQQQIAPTPSPRTPHSTDELLPSVEEGKEAFYNEVPTTSGAVGTSNITTVSTSGPSALKDERIPGSATHNSAIVVKSIFERELAPRASDDIFQV